MWIFFFFRKTILSDSRFMLFSTLKKNIEKCPFTYWLNGRWFLQIVERDSCNLYPLYLLSPAAPKVRDGRYCNAPRPSVCLSVCLCYLPRRRRPGTGDIATPPVRLSVCPSITFRFRTVTQKRIDVFSRNFAGMCTMSWGCAV